MSSRIVTVLIIESHPLMREALCSAIADEPDLRAGMQAASLAEALLLIKTVIPEVILLSLGEPGQVGMDALATLHRTLPAANILVLVDSKKTGQEQAAFLAGAQLVLTKAAPRAELLEALGKLGRKAILNHSQPELE